MTARSLVTALVLALAAAPASAQISDDHKLVAAFKSIVAKANESTVRIRAGDGDVSLGTVVFADGYILTKASEVRGEPIYVRFADGTEYEAEVVGRHRATDLAMLHVDAKGLRPITFADSKKVSIGSWLAAAAPETKDIRVGVLSAPVRELKPDPFSDEGIIVNHNRGFMGVRLDLTDPTDKDGHTTGAKVTTVDKDTPAAKAGIKEKDLIVAVD